MAYVLPRVQLAQEFSQFAVFRDQPLAAFIIGPHYALVRHSVALEKPLTAVSYPSALEVYATRQNNYQKTESVAYAYPNRAVGGDIDPTYTKVFFENVEAQYFPLVELGSLDVHTAVAKVETAIGSGKYYTNRLRTTDLAGCIFQTANSHTRSDYFSSRDVRVGDLVEVTDDSGNVLRTKVQALLADTKEQDVTLAATIAKVLANGTAGAITLDLPTFTDTVADSFTSDMVGQYITITDGGNPAVGTFKILAVSSSSEVQLDSFMPKTDVGLTWKVGGVYNASHNAPPQATVINSVPDHGWTGSGTPDISAITVENATTVYTGNPATRLFTDDYRVAVTTAGTLATARFSVMSMTGAITPKVNQALTMTVDGTDTIGTLILDDTLGNNVVMTFTEATPLATTLAVGHLWNLSVKAEVKLVNPTAAGEFRGNTDITYKLQVTRGGLFYDGTNSDTCAKVTLTTTGVESSSVVLPKLDEAFNVGTLGVTGTFVTDTTEQLQLNDVFYIPVDAARFGAVRSIQIAHSLPENMYLLADSFSIKLYLPQAVVQIPQVRSLLDNTSNWTQDLDAITINSAMTTYHDLLVSGLDPVRLPIDKAKIFVEHRDLLQTHVNSIGSLTTQAEVSTKLGTIHPDNPLAQGAYEAVLNAAGAVVYFMAVVTDDLVGYNYVLAKAKYSESPYSFVPMTFDQEVRDAVVSHVNAMSTKEAGRWRICWLACPLVTERVLWNQYSDDGIMTDYTATITDDPLSAGLQYRLVNVPAASFITDGLRPNDKLLINFKLSPNGQVVSDEFIVDQVRTESSFTTTRNFDLPVGSPTRIQIKRIYTKDEQIDDLAFRGGEYNNRRVRMVFPDKVKTGEVEKDGFYVAAALAGLRSGVVPHQGLTNIQILGFDDLSRSVTEFTEDQLNRLADQGILIVTQATLGATPYIRHQLTTDTSGFLQSEDSITTNVDSISYAIRRRMEPFTGVYNRTPEALLLLKAELVRELDYRQHNTYTIRTGNQITNYLITRFEASVAFKDRYDADIQLEVPGPINVQNITLLL